MGAFDRDKQSGLRADRVLGLDKPFVLLAVEYDGETIETVHGDAERVQLCAVPLNADGMPAAPPFWCNTVASAIVEKLRELDDSELPAVCMLTKVQSAARGVVALVIQYVAEYDGDAIDVPARR